MCGKICKKKIIKCKECIFVTSLSLLSSQQAVQLTKKGVHLHDYLKQQSYLDVIIFIQI